MLKYLNKRQSQKTEAPREMESTSLIQSCSIFTQPSLDIANCQKYLVSLLTALFNGEKFSQSDTTNIFFSITQAYNNKDLLLHRYLLLVLRYLNVDSNSAIMVTHSLSKDITSNITMNRARAVRLIPHILSANDILPHERFIKQIIISREPLLSICGLSCALALCHKGYSEIVKKWVTEIHNASASNSYAQHFALLILYYLRRGDGNLLRKMADQSRDRSSHSSLSSHVMIQVCSEAIKLSGSDAAETYLNLKLQSASPITQLDAARAILANERSSPDAINLAVTKLNTLLAYPNNVAIFAALRTIVDYAGERREEFSKCNTVLERLLSESNSNISALAAVSLLHTGFESTIDRVLPVISQFATKLGADQQASLLKSCVEVARRHPAKLEFVLTFMWSTFRAIDDYEVQKILVNGFFNFAEFLESSRLFVFRYLCEYVEDSKFSEMSLLVVRFIGEHGPQQQNRSELVRCLCNRLFLENAEVRAASIDSLAKFADCEDIGPAVLHVIKKHLNDSDDEVRDRATFYTQVLEKKYEELLNIKPPVIVNEIVEEKPVVVIKETPLDKYGRPILVSKKVCVTEDDSDLVIAYQASLFNNIVAVEFMVKNTLDNAIFEVDARMTPVDKEDEDEETCGLEIEETIPAKSIEKDEEGSIYVIFKRTEQIKNQEELLENLAFGIFTCEIVFFFEDDETNEETFSLDNEIKLMMNLYMKPTSVGNFKNSFESLSQSSTVALRLQLNNQDAAINFFTQLTGLEVISKGQKKDAKGGAITEVQFAGLVLGHELVLAFLEMRPPRANKLMTRVTVKSNSENILAHIMKSFE